MFFLSFFSFIWKFNFILKIKYSSFIEISIYPLSLRFISIRFLNKIPTLSDITNLTLMNLTKNLHSSFHTSSFYIRILTIFSFPGNFPRQLFHRFTDTRILFIVSRVTSYPNVGISTQVSKLWSR